MFFAENTWELVSVILMSTFKHMLGGVPLAGSMGLSYWPTFLTTLTGGVMGVFFYMFLFGGVQRFIARFRNQQAEERPRKKFKKTTRFIIRIKRTFGIWGIALIGPLFFSIPLGTLIATRIFGTNRKTLFVLLSGVLISSLIGGFVSEQVHELLLLIKGGDN